MVKLDQKWVVRITGISRMATNKEIKKKITEDWLSAFPQVSIFSQNKLYKIVGSCIIGIELIKTNFSDGYSPHFVVYSLWGKDPKSCLMGPVILSRLKNKKGLQFDIPYEKHTTYFNDAVECFKRQIPVSLNGDITLKSLFKYVDSLYDEMLVRTNSAQQARLFEFKSYVALYAGSQSQVQNVLNQIQQARKGWNMQMFETGYGRFDGWLQGLKDKGDNREEFLKQIEINKQDKKIMQLKSSEIIE